MPKADEERRVTLGRIVGLYGVRGWVKVYSWTRPIENIVAYSSWRVTQHGESRPMTVTGGRLQGKGVIAKLDGIDSREAARALIGGEITVERSQLPEPEGDEYYWSDLVGLSVETVDGVPLGTVDHLFETGANDVLVVRGERERLIPFVGDEVITAVDLASGVIRVDWHPDD